jgi:hypothetical protein
MDLRRRHKAQRVAASGGPAEKHYSLLSLLTTHYPLLTTHCSLLTSHYSRLTTHSLTIHYSLLATHYWLLAAGYALLVPHYSPLYSLPSTHYSFFHTHHVHSTHHVPPTAQRTCTPRRLIKLVQWCEARCQNGWKRAAFVMEGVR